MLFKIELMFDETSSVSFFTCQKSSCDPRITSTDFYGFGGRGATLFPFFTGDYQNSYYFSASTYYFLIISAYYSLFYLNYSISLAFFSSYSFLCFTAAFIFYYRISAFSFSSSYTFTSSLTLSYDSSFLLASFYRCCTLAFNAILSS